MRTRAAQAAAVAVVTVTAVTGCHGGGRSGAAPTTASPHDGLGGSPSATPTSASPGYTARQLANALIEPPAGATATVRTSGPLTTVLKKLSAGAPPVTDELPCTRVGPLDIKDIGSKPSAFVSFPQVGRSPSELLTAVPGQPAEQAITQPVPRACRTIETRVGRVPVTVKMVSDEPLDIGDGGRIIQTDQVTGGTRLHSWQVLFTGPGYLAAIELVGPKVTRADAESLARQAYRKAHATLR
ncbi:hypothetical protein [Actinoallomurus acaciae]|uniref:DUF5642 domain-containing protein n=1 Tax=Actinoallomurus acaciae TaxID=502577 RepID=A0ABV5YFQ2_9ACTN